MNTHKINRIDTYELQANAVDVDHSVAITAAPGKNKAPVCARDWVIKVKGIENLDNMLKRLPGQKAEEAREEFITRHQMIGRILAQWLRTNSEPQIESKLKYLTGSEQFSLADLNGLISVRYLAMGWHKIVYVVDFHSGQNGCANTTVVIKTEKRLGSIPRDQISRQSQLVDSGVASVPRIGDISENGSGLAYFEEFIDGVPLNDLRRDGLVTLVLRGQILRTLLAVYGQLGAIPVGIRPKQWIVRHLDQNKPETVWVDLGGTTQSAAFEILDSVNLWYGSHGFILAPKPWPSFKFWKAFANHEKPDVDSRDQELEKNDMLFNTVVDVLGREKGALFLNQVLSRASRHWVAPRYKFRKGDFQHAFRGGFLTGIKRRIFRTLWMEAWQVRRQFEFFIFRRELTAYLKKSATLSLP